MQRINNHANLDPHQAASSHREKVQGVVDWAVDIVPPEEIIVKSQTTAAQGDLPIEEVKNGSAESKSEVEPIEPTGVGVATESEQVDTTPSADARDLYRQPSPEELRAIKRKRVLGDLAATRQMLAAANDSTTPKKQSGAS